MAACITLAGESLKAQKQGAHEVLEITHFVLALVPGLDPNSPIDRSAGLPPAEQIVGTWAYTQKGFVDPNRVVYSLMLGSDIGDFDWNWIGLITTEGTLFAVSTVPIQQKRRNIPPLQTGNNVTRNFLVAFDGAQELTGITVEAGTWMHDFTASLAQKVDRTQFLGITHIGLKDDHPEQPFLISESQQVVPLWADTNAAEKLASAEVETLQDGDSSRRLVNAEFVAAAAKEATEEEAETGENGTRKMTPRRVFQALRSAAANASETLRGVLRIGTQAEIDAGESAAVAVTPRTLMKGAGIHRRAEFFESGTWRCPPGVTRIHVTGCGGGGGGGGPAAGGSAYGQGGGGAASAFCVPLEVTPDAEYIVSIGAAGNGGGPGGNGSAGGATSFASLLTLAGGAGGLSAGSGSGGGGGAPFPEYPASARGGNGADSLAGGHGGSSVFGGGGSARSSAGSAGAGWGGGGAGGRAGTAGGHGASGFLIVEW